MTGPAGIGLLACDLDGTLLLPDGTVTERTRRALRAAAKAGIETVLVTGRPPRFVRRTAEGTGVAGPVICSNGAVVYDWLTDEILHADTLSMHDVARHVSAIRAEVADVALALEWGTSFSFEARFAELLGRHDVPVVDDISTHPGPPHAEMAHKLLAIHPDGRGDELAEAIRRAVGDHLSVTHSGLPFIEMGPAGVTKASGLAAWAEARGLDASEVMAFGDMPNDVPMLVWAGWGVAMANAHPAAIEAADEVTAANVDDGVAQVVERLLGTGLVRPAQPA